MPHWINFRIAIPLILLAVYWLVFPRFPEAATIQFGLALTFGVWLITVVTWAPAAIRALWAGVRQDKHQLIIAIVATKLSLIFFLGWTIATRLMGTPEWMINHPIRGFSLWCCALSGMLFLTSPGLFEDGTVPTRNWLWIIVATTIGGLLAAAVALDVV